MGKALVIYKVYPEEPGQEKEIEAELKNKVKEGEIKDIKVEDVAFGLKLIKVAIVLNEGKNPEKAEAELKSIPNVREVEAYQTTLL